MKSRGILNLVLPAMAKVLGTILIVSSLIDVVLPPIFFCRRFEPIGPILRRQLPLVQMENRKSKKSSNIRLNWFKSSGFRGKA